MEKKALGIKKVYDKKELYPTHVEKAAALIESTLQNHPLLMGINEQDMFLMRILLLQSSLDIQATLDEKYLLVISIASGKWQYEKYLNGYNSI